MDNIKKWVNWLRAFHILNIYRKIAVKLFPELLPVSYSNVRLDTLRVDFDLHKLTWSFHLKIAVNHIHLVLSAWSEQCL